MSSKSLFALWVFILSSSVVLPEFTYAQDSNRTPLREILALFEKHDGVKFFYKNEWIKDINLDQSVANIPLADFITNQLKKNGIGVLPLYNSKYYVLFKGTPPVSSLIPSNHPADTTRPPAVQKTRADLYTLEGVLKDASTGEKIIGATVSVDDQEKETITNHEGYFVFKLPFGTHRISITAIGRVSTSQVINLSEDQRLDIEVFEKVTELNDIVITSQRIDRNVTGTEMSQISLDNKALSKIPQFMGEVDVIRSIMLLPGVSTVGEGASGFNVRGGNVDQNLILLDEVPLFNSSHLFGFFSTFNPDFVKEVTLLKGGMGANYGGRISSVLDVKMKDGNADKFSGSGGLGIVSSRLMLEGPIGKKTTFIVGGRIAYPDWIIKQVPDLNVRRSSSNFYDFNLRIRNQINDKNNIYFSAYRSQDKFKFAADTTYAWSTTNASIRWNTVITEKLFANVTGIFSNYENKIAGTKPTKEFEVNFGVEMRGGKIDFTLLPNERHHLDFGVSYTHYTFNPGKLTPNGSSSVNPKTLPDEFSIEQGYYISDEFKLNKSISIQAGLRYSQYSVRGEADVFVYDSSVPKSPLTIVDVLHFSDGEEIKRYSGWEPRLALKFLVNAQSSIKLSFNRNFQYLQLVSNTTAVSPLDMWKSSNYNIKPQKGDQVAIGYFRNFGENLWEFSVESYYKRLENVLEYKNGANLFINPYLESQLLEARGEAYGIEFLLRKKTGKLTGWLAYTYARSLLLASGATPEETINMGNKYPSNFDKPNDVAVVANYAFTRRVSFSANFTYCTGRPATYPQSVYVVDGFAVSQFSERNQERIPAYYRLDLSFTIEESLKRTKKWKGSWTFSIYNALGRVNPYSIFFKPQYNGFQTQSYTLSIIGTVFPAITYNFKF